MNSPSQQRRFSSQEKAKAILPLLRSPRDGREVVVKSIAAELGISARSVWRWFDAFVNAGTRALEQTERSDRGSSRFFSSNPGAALFAVCMFASGVTSPSALLHEMQAQLAGPLPSFKTLKRYIDSLESEARK